jgi:D-alanine-D-alanine ligase
MPHTKTKLAILFGGTSREALVSVASAQAIAKALPEAQLWFWAADNRLHRASPTALLAHGRPFEVAFTPNGKALGSLDQALDQAAGEGLTFVLALHGGSAENGEFQLMCELRGIPFTGSGSAASHLAFDKIAAKRFARLAGLEAPSTLRIDDAPEALKHYGRLIAKPAQDGSSFGLIFIDTPSDLEAVRHAALITPYLIEPFITGSEATCGVLEQADGSLLALPPVEIVAQSGNFDYEAKYLAKTTQEICPARFAPQMMARIKADAITAHKAMSCRGYSRSDFILTDKGPVFIETNTLPGLTAASLYPKALAAEGIGFVEFLQGQVEIGQKRST